VLDVQLIVQKKLYELRHGNSAYEVARVRLDFVELADQQVLTCLAETVIAELDCICVEVSDISDVEQLGDDQVS
jgi:hypothetical protein